MKIVIFLLLMFTMLLSEIKRDFQKELVDDSSTGLMWQDDKSVVTSQMYWGEAKKYCDELNLGEYDNWRLPRIEEILSIVDAKDYEHVIVGGFKNTTSSFYWSSTPTVADNSNIWGVDFNSGSDNWQDEFSAYHVRCVRENKELWSFEELVSRYMKEELSSIKNPVRDIKLVKDEFETTKEFQARVSRTKREQKKIIVEYKKKYAKSEKNAKKNAIKKALELTWGKPELSNLHYDADNGYFVADVSFENKKKFSKKIVIQIPRKKARAFKKNFDSLKPQAVFDYDGNSIKLKDIRVPYAKKRYVALFTDYNIAESEVAVNIQNDYSVDTNINSSISVASADLQHLDTSKLKDLHELERMLKSTHAIKKDKHRWLFAVGIEKYEYTDNIIYAKRTAQMFVKVAQKSLGVPQQNSFVLIDAKATQADIKNRFKKFLRRVQKGDTVYFYYNGHGVPVPKLKNEPFMLASNSEPDFIADEKFFSLQNIYTELSDSKAKKVIAFVDSCFSGVTDARGVLKGVAATKMVAKSVSFDKEKMVVMSAGNKHQYSNGYDKKGYRLFSYFVMKNILKGDTNIKTLYKDTKSETYDASLQEYGDMRAQEPSIEGNFKLDL